MVLYIQKCVDYLLHHFCFPCDSYNLIFYHIENKIIVKIMPHFVTSALFVGYSIQQVANNLEEIVSDIKTHLLTST